MEDDPPELISIDPAVCHGQPCIKGTRVMVVVVLDALAAGLDTAEILRHYPSLTPERVRAAVAYGAWLAKQEIRPLSPSMAAAIERRDLGSWACSAGLVTAVPVVEA